MFTSAVAFEEIVAWLSILRYVVKSRADKGFFDINKQAEGFYQKVLNLVYDKNLVVLESLVKNHPAIDLGDEAARFCIQVTSDNSTAKIRKTLQAFQRHGLSKKYDRLVVFVLTTKSSYEADFSKDGDIDFTVDDVWDVDDLLGTIEALDVDKMEAVRTLLKKEMQPLVRLLAPPDSLLARMPVTPVTPPVNALAYGRWAGFDGTEEEWVDEFNDIMVEYERLAALPESTREWLCAVTEKGRISREERIICLPRVIDQAIGRKNSVDEYQVAYQEGLADLDKDDYLDVIQLSGILSSGQSLFVLMRNYCSASGKLDRARLRKILVECDFRLLDD